MFQPFTEKLSVIRLYSVFQVFNLPAEVVSSKINNIFVILNKSFEKVNSCHLPIDHLGVTSIPNSFHESIKHSHTV